MKTPASKPKRKRKPRPPVPPPMPPLAPVPLAPPWRVNWRTTVTGAGAAIISTLTIVAALPAQLGQISTVFPEEWKVPMIKIGVAAALILRVLNALFQKDNTTNNQNPPTP